MTRQGTGADKMVEESGAGAGRSRSRHVWMLNHYAQEPGGAGGTRHYSLARHLRGQGWRTTVIAASTDHFKGRQRLADGVKREVRQYDGVPFLWLRTGGYAGNGADRVWNMLQYTLAALQPDNTRELQRPDVVIGSSVHPLAAWAGVRLARRHQVPFIFEVRDLWPQTLVDMGRLPVRHPLTLALRALEKSLYRNASRIITLLPDAASYITPLGVEPDRIVWIPNGADLELFPTVQPAQERPDAFTLMYFGAHGGANGLDNLLHAMKIVDSRAGGRQIRLRLIGDGPAKPSLMALADSLKLSSTTFEGPVPKSSIPALAAEADAFVICVRDLPRLYRFGISMNKIFDYLAAGRPVLISADVPGNPVTESGAGMTVAPDNPDALASAILSMASLPLENRQQMGMAGRHHLEQHYSLARLATILAQTLDSAVAEDACR